MQAREYSPRVIRYSEDQIRFYISPPRKFEHSCPRHCFHVRVAGRICHVCDPRDCRHTDYRLTLHPFTSFALTRLVINTSGFAVCSSAGQMQDGSSSAEFAKLLLRREEAVCLLPARLKQGEGVIGWEDRDREAAWICSAARRLGLDMDSVTSAIAIMDKVVCSTRVPAKYINCVAAACLHIAKKLWEDHEETTSNFLHRLRLEYSNGELKRMETRILTLLQWDVQLPTISRFLDAILSPLGATYLLAPIRSHIEVVVCNWRLMSVYRPSTISLSVVSLLLEGSRRHWVQSSHHLLKSLNIDVSELVRCRENIANLWDHSLVPSFSAFGLLPREEDEEPMVVDTSPLCSYSTPSVTSHSPGDLASPHPQPTPC